MTKSLKSYQTGKELAKDGALYLSGPMSGHVNYNYSTFYNYTKHLLKDLPVINPHLKPGDSRMMSHAEHLKADFNILLGNGDTKVAGLAMLPGWSRSRGAVAEAIIAYTLGLPLYDAALIIWLGGDKLYKTLIEVDAKTLSEMLVKAEEYHKDMNPTRMSTIFLTGKKYSGKSTVAAELSRQTGIPVQSFAGPLKEGLQKMGVIVSGPTKNVSLLQYVGTDLMRRENVNHWVDLMETSNVHVRKTGIIVDDCRFENEQELADRWGGTVYHLQVPEEERMKRGYNLLWYNDASWEKYEKKFKEDDSHASEQGIVVRPQDIVIKWDRHTVHEIVDRILEYEYIKGGTYNAADLPNMLTVV